MTDEHSQETLGEALVQSTDNGPNEVDIENLRAFSDIPVEITAVLGKTQLRVNKLLKLNRGSVIELDKKVGDPIDIYVNEHLIAHGEIVLVEDRIGITLTEIVHKLSVDD